MAMLKYALLLIVFTLVELWGSATPYAKLRDDINVKMLLSQEFKNVAYFSLHVEKIDALKLCLDEADAYALTAFEPKNYLHKLRSCEKKATNFDRYYVKALSEAVAKDNRKLFKRLIENEPPILKHKRFSDKAIKYYKSIQDEFSFKSADVYVKKYEQENVDREAYTQESALYEQKAEVLEYSKARNVKDKEGNLKTFFIGYKKVEGGSLLVAENRNPYEVSVLVRLQKIKNYNVGANKTYIFVIEANSVDTILRLYIKDRKKASSISWNYSWIMGDYRAVHDDSYAYALPFAKHSSVMITQGSNTNKTHKGHSKYAIDFRADIGTRVYAAREGRVVQVEDAFNKVGYDKSFAKYGNNIIIEHKDRTFSQYYHLKQGGARVKVGDRVSRGAFIGLSGNTGFSSGPHLHFSVHKCNYINKSFTFDSLAVSFKTASGVISNPKERDVFEAVR